ncbi:MAG: hypothetical protein N838_17435 [Thiohalocapsa sp. PB-PSB1]|nr:MAG: hypothetical protein N838_24555 [Thiohalocapsa sp. PB-PSB1]QQO54863.1 MAG: hypothetical protein N838_17435 [Thiohalocapsa sp. PB-PSB1]
MTLPPKIAALVFVLSASNGHAGDTIMCQGFYDNVSRKVAHVERLGNDLSKLAVNRLFEDLKTDIQLCISHCDGGKFDYCNRVAKWFEVVNDCFL